MTRGPFDRSRKSVAEIEALGIAKVRPEPSDQNPETAIQ